VCERCGWHGGLDDGLCIACQTIRRPTNRRRRRRRSFEWALERRCVYCGDVHDDRTILRVAVLISPPTPNRHGGNATHELAGPE
jgi:hypothetical protein